MEPRETPQQKIARVAHELGAELHRAVDGKWGPLRIARRNLGNRHVWRFRSTGGAPDRFLLLSHRAMTEGENPTARLLAQLEKERWVDRMQAGPETAFSLLPSGRLRARSVD